MSHRTLSAATGLAGTSNFAAEFGHTVAVGSQAISVSQLGAFYDESHPWSAPMVVTLYDESNQSILAQVTIQLAEVSASKVGQVVLKSITPVTIAASTSVRATTFGYGTGWYYDDTSPPSILTVDGGSGLVTIPDNQSWFNPTAGYTSQGYPTGHLNTLIVGPTFTYDLAGSGPSPGLTVSPSTATATSGGSPISITATRTNSSASLTATVSGGGTISTTAPVNGIAFTYTPPGSGSGTATVTVTDSTDSLSASCVIAYAAASALAIGPLSLTVNDSTGVTVGWSAATGGSGAKTYGVYRSSSPSVAGSLVGSTSALVYKDTSPGSSAAFYRLKVTDSASATATSIQDGSKTALYVEPMTGGSISLGCIGDSITAGFASTGYSDGGASPNSYPAQLALQLAIANPSKTVTVINKGASGSHAIDWSTNTSNLFTGAMAAFATAGVTHVLVQLGTNDAKSYVGTGSGGFATPVSTADYTTAITYITNTLVAAGYKVILFGPTYGFSTSNYLDEAAVGRLVAYQAPLSTLASANVTVFPNQGFGLFLQNFGLLADGIHPSDSGCIALANQRSQQVAQVLAGGTSAATSPTTGQIASAVVAAMASAPVGSVTGSVGSVTAHVTLDLTQPVPNTNPAGSVGDSLSAARAEAFGKVVYDPTAKTFTMYAPDNTTALRVLNITTDSSGNVLGRA